MVTILKNIFLNVFNWITAVVALAFGLTGDMPSVVRLLLGIMAIDIIAGIGVAVTLQKLSSVIAYSGISQKVLVLCFVGLAYLLAGSIANADFSAPIGQTVAGFYVALEAISILEKADILNIPLPQFLRDAVNKYGDSQKGFG